MRNALLLNGVFQGPGHMLLANDLRKPLGTIFAR